MNANVNLYFVGAKLFYQPVCPALTHSVSYGCNFLSVPWIFFCWWFDCLFIFSSPYLYILHRRHIMCLYQIGFAYFELRDIMLKIKNKCGEVHSVRNNLIRKSYFRCHHLTFQFKNIFPTENYFKKFIVNLTKKRIWFSFVFHFLFVLLYR